jgi:hypothetical protein
VRIVEETETEIYIEVCREELPINFASNGKKLHVRFQPERPTPETPKGDVMA